MFSCGATLTAAESMLDGEANGQPPDPDCRLVGARDPRRRLASIRVIELEKKRPSIVASAGRPSRSFLRSKMRATSEPRQQSAGST